MKKKPLSTIVHLLCCSVLLSFLSCATIPKAAPDLSLQLGKQVRQLEINHKLFVQKFFDEKRQRVDDFIQDEWLPRFAENFFADSLILNTYLEITKLSGGEKKRELVNLMRFTGPKLQAKIDEKRQELLQPLNELQQEIEGQISMQYDQVLTINNSLTNFLSSASKVEQNSNRYLEILGINQNKINGFIDKTDVAMSSLLGKATAVEGLANNLSSSASIDEKIGSFINTIKTLKGDLSTVPAPKN